jgi:hypothetical protein
MVAPPATFSPPPPPLVSPSVAQNRIERFILGEPRSTGASTPAELTTAWAGDTSMKLLDHLGNASSESPGGLMRWLAKWSYDGKMPAAAPRWAKIMAAPSATLSSLIAVPNPDTPRGVGYMTDPDLLAGRPTIDRRGMMVLSQLMCMRLAQAPALGIRTTPPKPGLTERQSHANDIVFAPCAACHRAMDPFGHAFGHFDHDGTYRDLDNGLPIDTSDVSEDNGGATLKFSGLEELTSQLAVSCDVAWCISQSLLREAINPDLAPDADPPFYDYEVLPIAHAFADSGFSLRALLRAVVESPAFLRQN